jgi:hypothetical protein
MKGITEYIERLAGAVIVFAGLLAVTGFLVSLINANLGFDPVLVLIFLLILAIAWIAGIVFIFRGKHY